MNENQLIAAYKNKSENQILCELLNGLIDKFKTAIRSVENKISTEQK